MRLLCPPRPLLATGLLFALVLGAAPARGADFPVWRGVDRNGIIPESGGKLDKLRTATKPTWKALIGVGYAAITVSGNRAYAFGNQNNTDTVYCFDAATGEKVWSHDYACRGDFGGYKGPRATPVVDGGVVFTFSGAGQVHALDAAKGTVVWTRDLAQDMQAKAPQWGFSGSPLVAGDVVLLNVGANGLALDRKTGKTRWDSGGGGAGYATPVFAEFQGQRGLFIFAQKDLIAVDLAAGKKLWSFPWVTKYDVNAADPIVAGNRVFISSNYGRGGALLDFAGGQPQKLWENASMCNHFNSSILHDGHLYGNSAGKLVCLEAKSGTPKWSKDGFGNGSSVLLVDGKLLVLGDRGTAVVAEASPAEYKELSRTQLLGGQCWTMPTVAHGRLYARNNGPGDLVCFNLN